MAQAAAVMRDAGAIEEAVSGDLTNYPFASASLFSNAYINIYEHLYFI